MFPLFGLPWSTAVLLFVAIELLVFYGIALVIARLLSEKQYPPIASRAAVGVSAMCWVALALLTFVLLPRPTIVIHNHPVVQSRRSA